MNCRQTDRAKFWFRLRRATTETVALALVAVGMSPAGAPGQAAETDESHDKPGVVREQLPIEFRHFLETVTGFRARFTQELWSDDQRLIEVAEGTVELRRPGRFRWHYDEPWEQLIVADGRNLWMYDVDISQVTRSDLTVNDPGNPSALLTGDADVLDSFTVVRTFDVDDEIWVELMPRASAGDYSYVRVGFAHTEQGGMLRALEFVDGLNQTTLIRFEDAEMNPELALDRFEFEPPPGVNVLGGPG